MARSKLTFAPICSPPAVPTNQPTRPARRQNPVSTRSSISQAVKRAKRLTEICSREGFVAQADGEATLEGVKLGDGQAAAVDGDRVANGAVGEDGGRVRDDKAVTFILCGWGDGRDDSNDLRSYTRSVSF